MNAKPHSHEVVVRNHGSFWGIEYGDQLGVPGKPFRWLWDSDVAYTQRCARRLRGHIARLVRAHDRMSQPQPWAVDNTPRFKADAWGSDQL